MIKINAGNKDNIVIDNYQDIISKAATILTFLTKEYFQSVSIPTLPTANEINANRKPSSLDSSSKTFPNDLILELKSSLKASWEPIRAKLMASSKDMPSSVDNASNTGSTDLISKSIFIPQSLFGMSRNLTNRKSRFKE